MSAIGQFSAPIAAVVASCARATLLFACMDSLAAAAPFRAVAAEPIDTHRFGQNAGSSPATTGSTIRTRTELRLADQYHPFGPELSKAAKQYDSRFTAETALRLRTVCAALSEPGRRRTSPFLAVMGLDGDGRTY